MVKLTRGLLPQLDFCGESADAKIWTLSLMIYCCLIDGEQLLTCSVSLQFYVLCMFLINFFLFWKVGFLGSPWNLSDFRSPTNIPLYQFYLFFIGQYNKVTYTIKWMVYACLLPFLETESCLHRITFSIRFWTSFKPIKAKILHYWDAIKVCQDFLIIF